MILALVILLNTRSLRSALLWNGELPLAEQARFKIQYEVRSPTDTASKATLRYTSNHFRAFCRMTRSVYTLCGFEKNKPVGFCVLCAICGNYKQKNYK